MAGQTTFGETAVGRLIARARRALAGGGAGPAPARRNGPPEMTDIHPPGSCARAWREADLSDLFAPETPDPENKKR